MGDLIKPKVIVLGAGGRNQLLQIFHLLNLLTVPTGVIGLTTAIKIQELSQCEVTIIAEVLPSDPKDIKYTSHWAVSPARLFPFPSSKIQVSLKGAHHVLNITEEESQQSEIILRMALH